MTFGHDLMSPHVILSDSAFVTSEHLSNATDTTALVQTIPSNPSTNAEFASYVERLLDPPEQPSNSGLLSPTEAESRYVPPIIDNPSMEVMVDSAIMNSSNATSNAKRTVNRYEITKSGGKVAIIVLTRSAYRLGETVPVAIDFYDSRVPCYSLHASLETSENIDQAIALRSKASIQRVTRRVHASHFQSTVSAERVLFNPMIPASAVPEFITTGVSLEWKLRFEFVTDRSRDPEVLGEDYIEPFEVVARDERGCAKAAIQGLFCETFDVTIPLRVYGAIANFDEQIGSVDFPVKSQNDSA